MSSRGHLTSGGHSGGCVWHQAEAAKGGPGGLAEPQVTTTSQLIAAVIQAAAPTGARQQAATVAAAAQQALVAWPSLASCSGLTLAQPLMRGAHACR